jgi:tetratricopeptide (TPR) repeat protein
LHEAVRTICEQDPPKLGTIDRKLCGDLETITRKALEKDPSRRYQSADALADDIRRYLNNEPILARRPSSLYVLRKSLGRHRVGVGICAAVVALGLVGLFAAVRLKQHELAEARQRVLRAQRDLEAGDVQAALGMARAEFAEHPELPEACLVYMQARFRAARAIGDGRAADEAVGALRDEVARNPSQWTFRVLLGELHRLRGDPRAAELQLQTDHHAPDTAEAWYLRSFTTMVIQNALRCAKEAVQRAPGHRLAWERLAYLCLQTEDLPGALAAAQKMMDLGGEPVEWLVFAGGVLTRQGRYREAVERYTQAADLAPTRWALYRCRALAHLCLKEYAKAVEDYSKAMNLRSPENIWPRYQRATPLWIIGRLTEAAADYRQARARRGGNEPDPAGRGTGGRRRKRRGRAEPGPGGSPPPLRSADR